MTPVLRSSSPACVVIGAGIVGVAVADALAARGAKVTVLDMRGPGRGASFASAGILAPHVESHHEPRFLELATRSLDMYDAFVADVSARSGRRVEYARTGTLEVALDPGDLGRLQNAQPRLHAAGIAHRWLSPEELRSFEPSVSGAALGGLLIEPHGFAGVSSLITALVQSARISGASFEAPVEVTEVNPRDDSVEVRAGPSRYAADAVVIAAGTWSGRVRIRNEVGLDVRPVRGQLLHLNWTAGHLPGRVVWGPRCYTVPWSDRSLLVGATVEDAGFDERSTISAIQELTTAANELLPEARTASLQDVRVGLRPASADELPIIGPLPSSPRVVVATGHYRNGVLLAPITAAIVRDYLLDNVRDRAIEWTRPDRFTTSRS
ncbi:MAG TPA: glycine oxidase ThiO [Vicinamibacterales bacterium]